MRKKIKKIILSSRLLTNLVVLFNKKYLKRKHALRYGRNVFIGFSVVLEGRNYFAENSQITSSEIGYGSYLGSKAQISKAKIGRYTSIAPNVTCVFGKHPSETFVSTHPSFFSMNKQMGYSYTNKQLFDEYAKCRDSENKYSILIGNDVWIGANVTIMDGVSIGDGAIIASNALVHKDIPAYTIAGGVPAKFIKNRFTEDQIKFLLNFKWWDKPEKWIRENAPLFADINLFYDKYRDD